MPLEKLTTSKGYFEKVLKPNYVAFMDADSTFQNMFNAAASLYHMHEWVYVLDKAKAESELQTSFAKPWDLWALVESSVANAGYIRDIANSAKHIALDPKRAGHRPK